MYNYCKLSQIQTFHTQVNCMMYSVHCDCHWYYTHTVTVVDDVLMDADVINKLYVYNLQLLLVSRAPILATAVQEKLSCEKPENENDEVKCARKDCKVT